MQYQEARFDVELFTSDAIVTQSSTCPNEFEPVCSFE
jgi:hypothetical protein